MADYISKYEGAEIDAKLDKVKPVTQASEGLMSAGDKVKLDGITPGAEANVIEGVSIDGVEQPITNKKVIVGIDTTPTTNSKKLLTSGTLKVEFDKKQGKAQGFFLSEDTEFLSIECMPGGRKILDVTISHEESTDGNFKVLISDGAAVVYGNPGQECKLYFGSVSEWDYDSLLISRGEIGIQIDVFDYGAEQSIMEIVEDSSITSMSPFTNIHEAYELPEGGIPESDLSESVQEKLVKEDGYYPKETVGSAESVRNSFPLLASFLQRKSGGGSGLAKIPSFKGYSLVWNSIVKDITNSDNLKANGSSTIAYDSTSKSIKVSISGTSSTGAVGIKTTSFVGGHEYVIILKSTGVTPANFKCGSFSAVGSAGDTLSNFGSQVRTQVASSTGDGAFWLWGTEGDLEISSIIVVDLTVLFNGNIQTGFTVDDFKAMFPLPYYAYESGKVLPFAPIKAEYVKFNQMINYGNPWASNIVSTLASKGITATINTSTGKITLVSGTASSELWFNFGTHNLIAGHKYLLKGCATGGDLSTYRLWETSNKLTPDDGNGSITTIQSNVEAKPCLLIRSGVTVNNLVFYPQFIDLTEMYGAGNEPTIGEFNAFFPDDYYPYNTGTTIPHPPVKLVTTGINQWDEVWEVGRFNLTTGINDDSTATQNLNCIRSKNYIPVIGGKDYYINQQGATGVELAWVLFFDANKNVISGLTTSDVGARASSNSGFNYGPDGTIKMPGNASYIRFYRVQSYGPSYNNDICINLSSPDINGHYFPYEAQKEMVLKPLKVYSHNIWDEVREGGFLNDGVPSDNNNSFRSKNFTKVNPGAIYYMSIQGQLSGCQINLVEYDGQKQYIRRTSATAQSVSFTMGNTTEYIKFYVYKSSSGWGTTVPTNDTCINESSSFNGNYEPHGVLTILDWGYSAGTARNEVKGMKYYKRLGKVDMGDMTWETITITYGDCFISTNGLPVAKNSAYECLLSTKYTWAGANRSNINGDKQITFYNNGGDKRLVFTDSAHTTAPTSQDNWLSGVPLWFELDSPIEYDLAEPMNDIYQVNKYGTEQWMPANTEEPYTAPCYMDVEYPLSAESLTSDVSLKNLLEALKTANKISAYTMTFNPDKGAFDFTIS